MCVCVRARVYAHVRIVKILKRMSSQIVYTHAHTLTHSHTHTHTQTHTHKHTDLIKDVDVGVNVMGESLVVKDLRTGLCDKGAVGVNHRTHVPHLPYVQGGGGLVGGLVRVEFGFSVPAPRAPTPRSSYVAAAHPGF